VTVTKAGFPSNARNAVNVRNTVNATHERNASSSQYRDRAVLFPAQL